jgi:hypothetical protein
VTVPVAHIHQLLSRTARRAVGLLLVRGIVVGVAVALATVGMVTVAVNAGQRSAAWGLLGLGAAVALGFAVRRWWGLRGLQSPRVQAVAIERVVPELRGGLSTVVDRTARPTGSAGLLQRLAGDVAARLGRVRPGDVWPLRPVWNDARWAAGAAVLVALVAIRGPLGPVEALRSLLGPSAAEAAVAPVSQGGPRALLGDVTLRYLYPTYTRLEPLEVPNTSGEVHAPRGTVVEVRARTSQAWEHATLQVTGAPDTTATLEGGRLVRASFTVGEEGVWRFDFGAMLSPDHRVVPEPDVAPIVAVAGSPRLREQVDANLLLNFSAKDDFGITRLVAEVTVNGKVSVIELRKPIDTPRAVNEALPFRPSEWGLRSGDVARVRVGAWDNDEVSGSKPGWSTPFSLEVLGAGGSFREQQKLRADLLAALIPPLADFLVDPDPVSASGAGVQRWADGADERYAAFDTVAEGTAGLDEQRFEARIVRNVNERRRDLLAFARGLGRSAFGEKDAATLRELHGANVAALEMAVFMLDRVQRQAAYEDLMELVRQLAAEARDLEGQLDQLDKPRTLAKLDQIVRLKARVAEVAAGLDQGTIRQFLESRGAELDGAIAATRRDVAAGDKPAARADMKRVADLLAEMAGGVEEAEKRRGEADDKLARAIRDLDAEFDDLAAREEALQGDVERARSQHGQSLDEGLAAWRRAERAAEEAEAELGAGALDKAREARTVQPGIDDARHDAEGLSDSVRARDVARAAQRAQDARESIARARSRLEGARRAGQVDAAEAAAAASALDRAARAADKAGDALEELSRGQSEASPALREALRSLSGRQSELAEAGRKASEQARAVGRELPVDASAMQEAAAEGAEQAQRAGEALEEGDALGADGATGAAAAAFRRAQRELRQAMQDMQEMQSSGGRGEEEGEDGGGRRDGEEGSAQEGGNGRDERRDREVAIPAPEEFATPEAYRKALLEGMQGEVPEAYRAANRRYYEELVRQ